MEQVPFQMTMGRSTGDSKTSVVEESAIGDESARDPVSVCGQRV